MISFHVPGLPAPQGSKRHVGGGRMVESSKRLAPWRATVALVASQHVPTPFEGPVTVEVAFRFPMPRSRPKKLREQGEVWRDKKPDLDKLLRAVFDGLTDAGAIFDDAQIVHVIATKTETTSLGLIGVIITIKEATHG